MYENFIDLDELIVQCRDKVSRKFIQEAVSCYRAGAFRSCIVSTWNAVVFDFLYKLRELELFGDPAARKLLEEFDILRSSGKKFKELWQFESNIPELAQTRFELISAVEKSDIERLFEDRSRCAHPSMTSLEEPFEATAELARYHLRSAVINLLSRPPVQGRAAKESIFRDIKSEYFPENLEGAIEHFKKGPLVRARHNLIKDIIVGLTKSLLIENFSEDERVRQFLALNAISNIYPRETRDILNENLSYIITHKVSDDNLNKAIIYLGSIDAWDSLNGACMLKAESFIDKLNVFEKYQSGTDNPKISQESILVLIKASHIGFLRESVIKKLQIPLKDLLTINRKSKDRFFRNQILVPILLKLSSQATLDELIEMTSEPLLKSDESVQGRIKSMIKNSGLHDLVSLSYQCYDTWLIDSVESDMEKKISVTNLENLLKAKSLYSIFYTSNARVLTIFDEFIFQRVKSITLDELINRHRYLHWDQISDRTIEFVLKDNILQVIDKFAQSTSFADAEFNSKLLVKIATYLSQEQWKNILEVFFENYEIHTSFGCYENFKILFKKSSELDNSLEPHWKIFRDRLNDFDGNRIDGLKKFIDDYYYEF